MFELHNYDEDIKVSNGFQQQSIKLKGRATSSAEWLI